MAKTSTTKAKRKSTPFQQQVRKISALFKGYAEMGPVERVEVFFKVGGELLDMNDNAFLYGWKSTTELVARVPQLGSRWHANVMMEMAKGGEEVLKQLTRHSAIPMSNGQPLTLAHWAWVFAQHPSGVPAERWERELDWLRLEAPSEAVMNRIVQMTAELRGDIEHLTSEIQELRYDFEELEERSAG